MELQPGNSVAKHMLSSLLGQTTKTAPLDYIETLFDRYADNFENSLKNELEYEIPEIIFEVIRNTL